MKKTMISLALGALILTSCADSQSGSYQTKETVNDDIKIVCTAFAYYDWTMNITQGSGAEVTYLLSDGVDMHSFQPTARDIAAVIGCDVLICGGGESEQWISQACSNSPDENRIVLTLLDDSALTEEISEGMQADEDGEEDSPEYDEHIWLSPKRAAVCCDRINSALCEADGKNAAVYSENTKGYINRLSELDEGCRALSGNSTLIVADRFPFLYLSKDYGIDYYAAFPGCSAESEASFETVKFLTGKCNELKTDTLYIIDGSDGKLANTVAGGCDTAPEIKMLDSMQSVSASDIENGTNYIGLMKKDIEVLSGSVS